jgi:hypothetical protein
LPELELLSLELELLLELGVVDLVDWSLVPPAELPPLGAMPPLTPPAVLLPDWPLLLLRLPPVVLVALLLGVVLSFMVDPVLLVPVP